MTPNFSLDTGQVGGYLPDTLTGKQLRTIREVNGLTQAQLAELLGIDHTYVSRFESGERQISRRTAIAVAAVINQHKAKQAKSA